MDDDIKSGGQDTSFTVPDIALLFESSNNNDVLEKNTTEFLLFYRNIPSTFTKIWLLTLIDTNVNPF